MLLTALSHHSLGKQLLQHIQSSSQACIAAFTAACLLAACGSNDSIVSSPPAGTTTVVVGGSLSGLGAGKSVVLQNNAANDLTLSANGNYTATVATGTAYNITVKTQPSGQSCTVSNGQGTAAANVSNINVLCANLAYTIGGSASGLGAGKTVVLQNNAGDDLSVAANGTFSFATLVTSGAAYNVSVKTQPAGQTCTVSNNQGNANANVSNVSLVCSNLTYTIGGNLTGLGAAKTVVLQNNAGNDLTLSANGVFSFSAPVAAGSNYDVTIKTQPMGQTCTATSSQGTANANVSNVAVNCVNLSYTIGGNASGLGAGKSVVLQNNLGEDLTVSSNAAFGFATPVSSGGAYSVSIKTQPAGQTCSISNGAGNAAANVTNVSVVCSVVTYTLGGSISGLGAGKTVVLQNNASDDLALSANANFTFASAQAANSAYNITVKTQPAGQTCTVSGGSAIISTNANVTSVRVICSNTTYSIGFTLSGVEAGKSIVVRNNGADQQTLMTNTSFTFPIFVAEGGAYSVTVVTQPLGQNCTVTNGSGTANAAVSNVAITCVSPSITAGNVTVGGFGLTQVRTYNVRLPVTPAPSASGHPLIILLHGNGGTAAIPTTLFPWTDAQSAVIVALQGLGSPSDWKFRLDGRNNATTAGTQPAQGPDDVQFISEILEKATDGSLGKPVDASKVFIIGYSRGAGMAMYAYADPRTKDRIAAIAPISGTFYCDMATANDGTLVAGTNPADADGNCGEVSASRYFGPKNSLFTRTNPARILGIWGKVANGEFAATQLEAGLTSEFNIAFNQWASRGGNTCENAIKTAYGAVISGSASTVGYRQRSAGGATTACALDITFLLDQTQGHVPSGYDEKIVKWFFKQYAPLP